MMADNYISSLQNSRVKRLVQLQQKSQARRKEHVFIVEGQRELQHCINAGLKVLGIYWCPEIFTQHDIDNADVRFPHDVPVFEVSRDVYEKISYRGSTEGVVAEIEEKHLILSGLQLPENPLIVVLESVEKPGNLGAILRSADAAGVDAVIVSDPRTDLYNPNLIRSSIGAIFTVPCLACTSEECIDFLKRNNIRILTAQLQDSELYYDTDMTCGTAIVMGTESTGLTEIWRKAADAHIRIPMLGKLDSLNVSVSAAVLMYEAVRQRQTKQRC